MKKHKVKNIIKKSGENAKVVFADGASMFVPRNMLDSVHAGLRVTEHINKNGTTVAYSWDKNIRFVGAQPMHYANAIKFIEDFKLFDRVRFNNAVMDVMHYRNASRIFPDTEKFAHNLVLLGIKTMTRGR